MSKFTINNRTINISPRIKLLSEMCIQGEPVADIGTDHGFVPIHLLAENMTPYVILSDVNEGPLQAAKNNLSAVGLSPEYYDFRLGSGLEPLEKCEVSTAVIAGMGGELIESILGFDEEKSHSIIRFVLQPRTRANELRYYLSTHGFEICDYRLVKERGRICELFSTRNNQNVKPDTALISEFLLAQSDPLIGEFLDYKLQMAKTVLDSIQRAKGEDVSDLNDLWSDIYSELSRIKENI